MVTFDHELSDRGWRMRVAERLTALRSRRKMTRAVAAKLIGYPSNSLGDYEEGNAFPGLRRLSELARFYDCSIDFILLGLGWGGVQVANYEELLKSATGIVTQRAPRAPGKKIAAKLPPLKERPAPRVPKLVHKAGPTPVAKPKKSRKGTALRKVEQLTPAPAPKTKRKKGDKMSYDFSLD
jgi:transcriptional regulator with XRE-family HTH domain